MSAAEAPLQVGDRIRLTEAAGAPDGVLRDACADRLLRVQRTEGNDPGYILVSGTRYGDQWLPAADFELVERRQPSQAELMQRARDVLAKWRERATSGPWRINANEPRWVWGAEPGTEVGDLVQGRIDGELIVGTAGNPDLLDAIDLMLRAATHAKSDPRHRYDAERIAAAIIAADERISR